MKNLDERLGRLVRKLDTAGGMLLVASMTNSIVNKARTLVTYASLELDKIINEILIEEEPEDEYQDK